MVESEHVTTPVSADVKEDQDTAVQDKLTAAPKEFAVSGLEEDGDAAPQPVVHAVAILVEPADATLVVASYAVESEHVTTPVSADVKEDQDTAVQDKLTAAPKEFAVSGLEEDGDAAPKSVVHAVAILVEPADATLVVASYAVESEHVTTPVSADVKEDQDTAVQDKLTAAPKEFAVSGLEEDGDAAPKSVVHAVAILVEPADATLVVA